MATFTARYSSDCAACCASIDPGDEAGYIDDEVCCEDCYEAAQD